VTGRRGRSPKRTCRPLITRYHTNPPLNQSIPTGVHRRSATPQDGHNPPPAYFAERATSRTLVECRAGAGIKRTTISHTEAGGG